MKKKFIALGIMFCVSVAAIVMGLSVRDYFCGQTDISKLHVRVNGYEVQFTDAQPYIDENSRTMIPLRACVEALGAEVTWDQETRTASITKNGVTVKVTIDSKELTVNDDGLISYVTMDTQAVLNAQEGRTYVPIRYVAEALGAYVDYSAAFRTVGIWQDVLTSEQIAELHSYDYVQWDFSYEDSVRLSGKESADESWPYHAEMQESFANARECLYDSCKETAKLKYYCDDLGVWITREDSDYYFDTLVKETVAFFDHDSDVAYFKLHTDGSCVYAKDYGSSMYICLRGYLEYENRWQYGVEYAQEDLDAMNRIKRTIRNRCNVDVDDAYEVDDHFIQSVMTKKYYIPVDIMIVAWPGENYYVDIYSVVPRETPESYAAKTNPQS